MNNLQFEQWCQRHSSSTMPSSETPLIMGILNVTPDSFSDGGLHWQREHALRHALHMVQDGADIIDIGGESTRPGALPVSIQEEMDRVIPVIEHLRAESDVCISVDTSKAAIMQAAVVAGAGLINDITALKNPQSLTTAASLQVPVCLMHMQGTPQTMQINPSYEYDIIGEINHFFKQRIEHCLAAGLKRERLILDPGFGFGKSVQHNLQLIRHLSQFKRHHLPIMIGLSRKSTLGKLVNKPVGERAISSAALHVMAALKGVSLIRTHDVDDTKQAMLVVRATQEADGAFSEDITHVTM